LSSDSSMTDGVFSFSSGSRRRSRGSLSVCSGCSGTTDRFSKPRPGGKLVHPKPSSVKDGGEAPAALLACEAPSVNDGGKAPAALLACEAPSVKDGGGAPAALLACEAPSVKDGGEAPAALLACEAPSVNDGGKVPAALLACDAPSVKDERFETRRVKIAQSNLSFTGANRLLCKKTSSS
jgi:hypothetical protein